MINRQKKSLEERMQRLEDIQEIHNLMGMHEYYHAANMHQEEIDYLFAQKTPGVCFDYNGDRWEGLEALTKFWVTEWHEIVGEKTHEDMRKLYPQIEDDPKNAYVGLAVMHTLTTPVIEVAEDGETAKGVWVSPGHLTRVMGGKLRSAWYWCRYGVDFVKEDGEWKIWHMVVFRDFITPYDKSWAEFALDLGPDEQKLGPLYLVGMGFSPPNAQSTPYKGYQPFAVAEFRPRPPEPYRTFSETFSY